MEEKTIVTVAEGKLQGKICQNHSGGKYYSFQGIPYAKPPIGDLRFKSPSYPAASWTGIRDATEEGSACYSRDMVTKEIIGSEDCLFLNVYTPQLPEHNSTSLKPVMVWIHGGGFTSGCGSADLYGPDFLIQGDVVIVAINYRLGLLGFLCMDDVSLGVPGNAGLKDQVAALKWVQNNIAKFNGDPNNVTIFGESAGGSSVHYLLLSPMAKGLFHKAIAQSGSALSSWANGQRSAASIAQVVGIKAANEKEVLTMLQEMPVEKIFQIQEKVPDPFIVSEMRPFGPVVETKSSEPGFLLQDPVEIIASGEYNKVPLMVGFTSREGMISEISSKFKYGDVRLVTNFEKSVPYTMKLPTGSDLSRRVAKRIKQFYYGTEEPSFDNIDLFYLLQTDTFFLKPIHSTLKLHVATSSLPIYLYRMSIDSTLNMFKRFGKIGNPGACHADDIGYLFKNAFTPKIRAESIEEIAIYRFVKLWTTFARYGNPNPIEKDPLINVNWNPIEINRHHFLNIDENLTLGVNPEEGRMKFWDEIYGMSPAASKL